MDVRLFMCSINLSQNNKDSIYINNKIDALFLTIDNQKYKKIIAHPLFVQKKWCSLKINKVRKISTAFTLVILFLMPIETVSILSFPAYRNHHDISLILSPENISINDTTIINNS